MEKYEIKTVTTATDFAPWMQQWDALAEKQYWPTPYHQSFWLHSCFQFPDNHLVLSMIIAADTLVAGFAFCSHPSSSPALLYPTRIVSLEPRIDGVRPASLIALISPQHTELPLQQAIAAGLHATRWTVGFFQYCCSQQSRFTSALRGLAEQKNWKLIEGHSAPEAYIQLGDDVEEFFASIPTKLRRSLNNAYNSLKLLEVNEFCELTEKTDSWDEIEAAMISVYKRSWQSKSDISPFAPHYRQHFLSACKRLHQEGRFRAFFLTIFDEPIAFDAYFLHATELFPVARGYDKKYKHLSSGNMLIAEAIRHFHAHGIRGMYWGPIRAQDRTAYKQRWSNQEWDVPNLMVIRPKSLYGTVYHLFHKSKLFQKCWWKFKK
jgi:hypothetical protein